MRSGQWLVASGQWTLVLCLLVARPAVAWEPRGPEEIKKQTIAALDTKKLDAATRKKGEELWASLPSSASEEDLLAWVVKSYALVEPRAAQLEVICRGPHSEPTLPDASWLRKPGEPAALAANLRLYYAQWLVHESMFDEALEQIADLKPDDVAAPASLLFNQSVAYRALLDKKNGLKSIGQLLDAQKQSPRRYVVLAQLMQEDLKTLKDDTLDHIARQMGDIRRRLDLGRAGPKVRKEQDGVIKSLDKIIKKLEDQQKEQSGGGGSLQSSSPAQKSQIMGGRGPGEVTKKNVGVESGWGNLPPKERQQAMQQIGRDFPSHYRDAIEQYFRRLAAEGAE